ncbi:hypothetical protein [Streptomyces sp. ID05-18]|uniref:hypothetical protein n=1 Tax=Streptomyces sp. ID05-18 TaxID=3028662 RepID=UPI0029ADC1E8|nr:hypothetical protein [Streptomyces sp. ID05-18]MDX3485551.1 hypothetical protein [Streptomyces sp. ID05-18]
MTERAGTIIFALTLAAGVLTGCSQADEGADAARATPSVRTIPINLYTHCGIGEAHIGSTYYEAETPLTDGNGNPPEGWDNPFQHGTMTLKTETEGVFTDDAGHEVKFRARPGASGFKRLCS